MVKIEVNYYTTFAKITGKSYETVEMENPTLRELVTQLLRKYGRKLSEITWDEAQGDLKNGISVLINGRNLPLDTKLQSSDQVAFLMPMAGG
ncbi:MAG: MoaD family protein [Candidatus Tectomicrobia bacterium]|uniref:MoaD family protein n=1 Tax=Tectimicrobiota bacterium TaxID=2528274 RepID=A0A933GKD3_UNCTE|nr:MoaD family protein [Candidatus Tectomicrobia bacterium]